MKKATYSFCRKSGCILLFTDVTAYFQCLIFQDMLSHWVQLTHSKKDIFSVKFYHFSGDQHLNIYSEVETEKRCCCGGPSRGTLWPCKHQGIMSLGSFVAMANSVTLISSSEICVKWTQSMIANDKDVYVCLDCGTFYVNFSNYSSMSHFNSTHLNITPWFFWMPPPCSGQNLELIWCIWKIN